MIDNDIPALDLFMICPAINRSAMRELPDGYSFRNVAPQEHEAWKDLQADDPSQREAYNRALDDYYAQVYSKDPQEFYRRAIFACDPDGIPVGTCMIWKAYGQFSTVHWFKVKKACESLGIGRALLSRVMGELHEEEYPVFLHTHPSCYRAIKLYSDFGFKFLRDSRIGHRGNDLAESLSILKRFMPAHAYAALGTAATPQDFLKAARNSSVNEF